LQRYGKILRTDRRDDGLKFISTFARYTDFLPLDLSGHFEFAIANETRDLLCDGRLQSLFDFDDLARMAKR
jgi:hypothetical protein